jgi:hypothetical protein
MNNVKNGNDGTLARVHIKNWLNIVSEYQLIKAKKHPTIKKINDLFQIYKISRQHFHAMYTRYLLTQDPNSFLPQKRGPKMSK